LGKNKIERNSSLTIDNIRLMLSNPFFLDQEYKHVMRFLTPISPPDDDVSDDSSDETQNIIEGEKMISEGEEEVTQKLDS
jgi:hypothetical protein